MRSNACRRKLQVICRRYLHKLVAETVCRRNIHYPPLSCLFRLDSRLKMISLHIAHFVNLFVTYKNPVKQSARGLVIRYHYTTWYYFATVARSSYNNNIQSFAQLIIISPMHLFVID